MDTLTIIAFALILYGIIAITLAYFKPKSIWKPLQGSEILFMPWSYGPEPMGPISNIKSRLEKL